jgi:hypothetical protein
MFHLRGVPRPYASMPGPGPRQDGLCRTGARTAGTCRQAATTKRAPRHQPTPVSRAADTTNAIMSPASSMGSGANSLTGRAAPGSPGRRMAADHRSHRDARDARRGIHRPCPAGRRAPRPRRRRPGAPGGRTRRAPGTADGPRRRLGRHRRALIPVAAWDRQEPEGWNAPPARRIRCGFPADIVQKPACEPGRPMATRSGG